MNILKFLNSRSRFMLFAAACATLVVAIALTVSVTKVRSLFHFINGAHKVTHTVHASHYTKGAHAIRVTMYGTARPNHAVTLKAPLPGTIATAADITTGSVVAAGEVLFSLEKDKLDFAIKSTEEELKSLALNKTLLKSSATTLTDRLSIQEKQHLLAKETLKKQQENYEIEKTLFDKTEKLFNNNNISKTEFLQGKASLHRARLSAIGAEQALEKIREVLSLLRLEIYSNDNAIESLATKKKQIEIKHEELSYDREKSDIKADFPAFVTEAFVDAGQEVTVGTPLATIRSRDAIEMTLPLPDVYFSWLYAGDLLTKKPKNHDITFRLVNRSFDKVFTGGTIKAVGDHVVEPTRSLPIVVTRANPVDNDGDILAAEELKPGMYCAVTLDLHDAPNTFLLPPSALQNHNTIYLLDANSAEEVFAGNAYNIEIVREVKILHESAEGLIVELPEKYSDILLIDHAFKHGYDGAEIYVETPIKEG
jgi:multidrug efflux pump subunit AcrA (membrane-fusion protein)